MSSPLAIFSRSLPGPGHCSWRPPMPEKPDFNRRHFCGAAAATVAAASFGLLTSSRRLDAMTEAPTKAGDIRPFKVNVPEAQITDLRSRIKATRWPEREIVTHGWPGSIIEQLKIIDPLTNPTAHGGSASDAFDVVIPSLPGYGFSGKPTTTGWDPIRIARAWVVLMKRLGYTRFVAQGGDWGNAVTEQMALLGAPELIGIHTNMPATVPPDIDKAAFAGAPAPSGLSSDEKHAYDQLTFFYKQGLGYANEMANRPQTLYGIGDSPVGMAAWMLDHDARSLALITRVFDGEREGLTRDDILDNVTLYWLTNTTISSARLYWESHLAFFAPKNVPIPAAVSAFPEELYQAPRSWTEKAYPKLIYYNKLAKGGHFAAWEQPGLLVTDLRAAFKSLR